MDESDVNENTRLLRSDRTQSEVRDSLHSLEIVFDSKMMKTSTQTGDLAATWGGRRSLPDSGRRRTRSWSGGPPDDVSSEIRILRERLVRTQTRPHPGAVRYLTSRQRLTLASLALVDFISFCSMSIMAPFFPREATAKGLSDTMSGMVFSFYAVVMFITSPIFGKFLPTIGAKFMFTTGMFVAGACNVLFGTLVLINDSITFTALCFLVRGLEALGASAYSTASYVFVVNAFPDSIGSVLGILETFVGLGMSVGPAIGGLLYSIGGFGLPFYTLGVIMVFTVPINFFLLNDYEEYVSGSKSASILRLFKIPSIIITGLVIVIVSNTWAFLDPTLEPHLRQFNLSTEQIGLIFLLFSSLYGIFSPIWGWVADRVHNHWCMMVWGLFLSSIGLLLLGPCPFIPGLSKDLWLDLVALSILGVSVALTLLPTFQGVLTSSIYEGGCPEALATYSAVAGVWSCCYSLGEVLGPALGGALTQRLGFPLCATLCAAACFTMAIVTLTFFCLRESSKAEQSESGSESIPYTDTTWNSSQFCRTRSAPPPKDISPLLTPCSCVYRQGNGYGSSPPHHVCLLHNKSNKSGAASITEAIAYVLKFQFITNAYIKIRKSRRLPSQSNHTGELYQNYLENDETKLQNATGQSQDKTTNSQDITTNSQDITTNSQDITINSQHITNKNIPANSRDITSNSHDVATNSQNITPKSQNIPILNNVGDSDHNKLCNYLEEAIFGSPVVMENVNTEHLKVKKNKSGLVPNMMTCDEIRSNTDEMLKHNVEKVHFYEQSLACSSIEDIFDGCECRDGVTYVPGTITVSSTGACEV